MDYNVTNNPAVTTNNLLIYRDKVSCYVDGMTQSYNENMVLKICSGNGSFSWFTWLLGPGYFIYRRCYSGMFITLGVKFLVALLFAFINLGGIGSFVSSIIAGFMFYPLYKQKIDKTIRLIDGQYASPEAAAIELRKAGGVNTVGGVLFIIGANLFTILVEVIGLFMLI